MSDKVPGMAGVASGGGVGDFVVNRNRQVKKKKNVTAGKKKKKDSVISDKDRLKLLECFANSEHKCHYICTVDDRSIEVVSDLVSDFIHKKIKVPGAKKIAKILRPIRHLIRILADDEIKTHTKRKILIQFGIKLLLYPIISKNLIPCFGKACLKQQQSRNSSKSPP